MRFSKQTEDKKLADALKRVQRELSGLNEKIRRKSYKTISDNKTSQQAIAVTQNEKFSQLTMKNTQNESHPGLFYDPSLDYTLQNIEKSKNYLEKKEKLQADMTWNGIYVQELGGTRDDINGSELV